jgi:hypothetical protein
MRRDMRREAGLPVMQRQRQDGMGDFAPQPAPAAPQSPMVMGQPTGDMMAFRPMPTERPSMAPMSPGFGPGAAQGVGSALAGQIEGQPSNPLRDQMLRFNEMSPEMQAKRNEYMEKVRQGMPYAQAYEQTYQPNYGPMPSPQMPMQQPMQQEPGYLGSIRRMMDTGRMDANHPAAQAVRGYDRQNMMNMFGQKQPQNQLAQGLAQSIGSSNYFI